MSLKNICFENIKDEFYYGKFGEFTLIVDKNTGYFNATKLCQQSNKKYGHWMRLDKTKKLFDFMIKSRRPHVDAGFSYEKLTSNYKTEKLISGTYLCKELILDLASWISPSFYLQCNDIILNYFEREYQSSLKEKDDKIDYLINQNKNIIDQNNNLLQQNTLALKRLEEMGITLEETREQNEEILEELHETNDRLDRVLPDRNVDPKDDKLKHSYVLLKSKLIDNEYMFLRGQDKYIKNKKNAYNTEFEITIDQTKNPNPVDLVNRLKEKIQNINEQGYGEIVERVKHSDEYIESSPSRKRTIMMNAKRTGSKIIYRLNKISLMDYPEEDFLKLVKILENEKYNV